MDIVVSVFLPLGLAFIMFSLGAGLTPDDFLRVGQRPLAFLVGAVNQIVLLPLVAFLCILLFDIKAELAVGFMILAACPGGVTSNIISKLAKADVALSVSLTAVISIVSMITVPIVLSLAVRRFIGADAPDINITTTALTMFALTVVPMSFGLAARMWAPVKMTGAEPTLTRIASILFAIIVVAALAGNWQVFVSNASKIGPALLVMLTVLTLAGFFLSRMLGRNHYEAKTISIETGVQNSTLGISIAAILVGSENFGPYALPSAIYGILMYLIIVPVVLVYRRMD